MKEKKAIVWPIWQLLLPKLLLSSEVSNQTGANQALAVQHQGPPLVPIHHVQQQGQIHQTVMGFNPDFQPAGC